jgi:heptosyltransferase-2
MKTLVVAPSWIGDMVLAQPLLKLLHARNPGLALDALAPRWTLPLLGRMPEIRNAIESPFAHGDLRLAGASAATWRGKATTRRSCCPIHSNPP